MASVARLSLAGLGLAACHGSASTGSPPAEMRNLGLATHALVGAGELWLLPVREDEQGGRDGNGDGDADDELVVVLDLARGLQLETALAVGAVAGAPGLLACDGTCAAFAVDEAAQGARDLNGDGDALDRVLFVFERARARVESLALAVSSIEVGGALVAAAVDEAAHFALDLDGDGDATGTVLAVHDLGDGSTTRMSLRDSAPLLVRDERVALRLSEREGLDLTRDGDDLDTAVFEVYDGRTRLLQNTTLALAGSAVASAGGTFGFSVSEAGQGRGDLSGDGDADDGVFHVYDPERGFSINLGLVVPLHPPPAVDGERYLLHAREQPSGIDANQDGDLDDLVVHVFEARAGLLLNTALASQSSAALVGGWVGVSVSESMQGSSDLDGDGESGGNLVHVFELASGALTNLGLDAFVLHASAQRMFVAPFEELAAVDWNDDGDRRDSVLFDWSALDGSVRSGVAVGAVLAVQGDVALVLAREGERGGDGNGDGDADDLLLELHDAHSGEILALGLSAGSGARLTPALTLLALVEEQAQGRDLNGDGDLADEVLHVRAPPR